MDKKLTFQSYLESLLPKTVEFFYSLDGNACGGLCHVVLDDGNLDDGSIDFCLAECQKHGDWLGAAIMTALRSVPHEHRERATRAYYEE